MGYKMNGWSAFKKEGKTNAELRKEKFNAKNLENLKKGDYGHELQNAVQYDPYTNKAQYYDPSGKYRKKSGKYSHKLEYGKLSSTTENFQNKSDNYEIPTSGNFVRKFNMRSEKAQRNRSYGSGRHRSATLGKAIMEKWNDQNPVYRDQETNELRTRSRNPHIWGKNKEEGLKNIKNLGTIDHFEDSQVSRVKGAYRGKHGIAQHGRGGGKIGGRKKVKGEVHAHIESGGVGGQSHDKSQSNYFRGAKEAYVEGKKMTKTNRRMKGSLNMQRDKVKNKDKGYVRKTGEGFLGLQNRKKYIDGVEVVKGKNRKQPIAETKNTTSVKADDIKVDMPAVVVTPKMQKKRERLANKAERKNNRVANRARRKQELSNLNQQVRDYRQKNYGV